MKKRIFSRVLALVMAMSLLSTTAFAYSLNEYISNYIGEDNGYIDLKAVEGDNIFTMENDIQTDKTFRVTGDGNNITLNMNGYTLDHQNSTGSVISVDNKASLTVNADAKDEDGNITSIGLITGGNASNAGGGIYVSRGSSFEMVGGEIKGNHVSNGSGGGIYGNASTITLDGTVISQNSSTEYGGGISVNGCDLTLKSTIITENDVKDPTKYDSGKGGGLFSTSTTISVDNAKLFNNHASVSGDDIYVQYKTTVNGTLNAPTGENLKDAQGNEGNAISGWYEDWSTSRWDNGINLKDADTPADGTYAWIALKAAHGATISFEDGSGNVIRTVIAKDGSLNENPTRDGYIFDGWYDGDEKVEDLEALRNIGSNKTLTAAWREAPSSTPSYGDNISGTTTLDTGTGLTPTDAGTTDTTTITDEETPLAGLVTLAKLLETLRQYEGVEDVELPEDYQWADHDYAQAIYWALDEALVLDTEDDPLDPDELVTVAILREVLENFVEYKGADLTVTVDGEDDMIVMDLGERLTVFYSELEAALADQAA